MSFEHTIRQLLDITCDPFLHLTAPEMQIEPTLILGENAGQLHLVAGFPIECLTQTFIPHFKQVLAQALPHYPLEISLTQAIKPYQTQRMGHGLRGVKNVIAVGSGKGGVGKSTVTVNLAVTLAKLGARVGILDADIYGPSIPMMLGKAEPVQMAGERYQPIYAHGVYAMSIGYLTQKENSTLIWRGPMLAKALLQMLDITLWDELDYLFIDLPPGTGDIQLSLVQKIPLSGAIIVTTPQQIATQDADKALNLFKKTNIHVLGIVENMATHFCSQCGHEDSIFGSGGATKLCEAYQCRYLGQLPLQATIAEDCDQGTPSALRINTATTEAWMSIAMQAATALATRPLNYVMKNEEAVNHSPV